MQGADVKALDEGSLGVLQELVQSVVIMIEMCVERWCVFVGGGGDCHRHWWKWLVV